MMTLATPTQSADDVFTLCISRVRDQNLAMRLAAAKPAVVAASNQLNKAALSNTVHSIPTQTLVAPNITVKEMESVYTQRMVKKQAPGRHIYDQIFASAPNGRCPLCMQRNVATLDHYLPKAHYPALVVAPLNLIPACTDCNKSKLDSVPTAAEEVPLHPYFDDLGNDVWLTATVLEVGPSALKFTVTRPPAWNNTLYARVNNHFQSLGLAVLYASQAAEELINIRHQLKIYWDIGGCDGVRDELELRLESCSSARTNTWRTAAYRAWSQSDWFCEGGFKN